MKDAVKPQKIIVPGVCARINGMHLFSKLRKISEYMQLEFMDRTMINQEISQLATNILFKNRLKENNCQKVLM